MEFQGHEPSEDHSILGKRKRSQLETTGDLENQETQYSSKSTFKEHPIVESNLELATDQDLVTDHGYGTGSKQTKSITTLVGLPPEVLQHILCFMDPFSLARMMRTNRKFQSLLDSRQSLPYVKPTGILHALPQDRVWTSSRSVFLPHLQKPLATTSELESLRLIYGRRCDYCGRVSSSSTSGAPVTPWNSGPGIHGVRTIWPFKVKSCTKCLRSLLLEEAGVSISILELGPPFVHFSPSFNYVTSFTLNRRNRPRNLKLTKYYFRPQVEDFEKSAQETSLNGAVTYNSWLRGLQANLADFISDCGRLEFWEESSQLTQLDSMVPSDTASVSSVSIPSGIYSATQSQLTSTSHTAWQYSKLPSKQTLNVPEPTRPALVLPTSHKLWATTAIREATYLKPDSLTTASRSNLPIVNIENMERMRADRRAEIEARCSLLPHPIPPDQLERLKAFQAAIHTILPLDENSWGLLTEQLLLERQEIASSEPTISYDAQSRLSRQTVIPEDHASGPKNLAYINAQAYRPTRDKLDDIAKEYIEGLWKGGTHITEATAPQFAADVLQHVRQRFYETQQREDAILALNGEPPVQESQSGLRVRTLNLDHMKHVFSERIKPYTEYVRKELFRCSACDTSDKYFGFDAILQHYAAKHTRDFSRGNSTISWKANWPSNPPFHTKQSELLTSEAQIDRVRTSTLPAELTDHLGDEKISLATSERRTQDIDPIQAHPASYHSENTYSFQEQHRRPEDMPIQHELNSTPSQDIGIAYAPSLITGPGPHAHEPFHIRQPLVENYPHFTEYRIRYEPVNSRPPSRSQYLISQHHSSNSDDERYVRSSGSRTSPRDFEHLVQEQYPSTYLNYHKRTGSPKRHTEDDRIDRRMGEHLELDQAPYTYGTTERFLDNLDPEGAGDRAHRISSSRTSINHPRSQTTELRAPAPTIMDHISNSAQVRKPIRYVSPIGIWQHRQATNIEPVSKISKHLSTIEHESGDMNHHRGERHEDWPRYSSVRYTESPQRHPQYQSHDINCYRNPPHSSYGSYNESRLYSSDSVEYAEHYGRQVHPQSAQVRYDSPLGTRPMQIGSVDGTVPLHHAHYPETGTFYNYSHAASVSRDAIQREWHSIGERPYTDHTSRPEQLQSRERPSGQFDEHMNEYGRPLHDATSAQSYPAEKYHRT